MKKILILLLAVLMLAMPLTACKSKSTGNGQTQETLSEEPQNGGKPEETLEIPENLSFLDANGNPREVNVMERLMTGAEASMEFDAKETDTDIVSFTIYKRNETINARLGVELNIKTEAFSSDAAGLDRWNTFINNLFNGAGTDPWIVDDYAYTAPSNALKGFYYDMNDLNPLKPNYLHFEKIWWNQNYINEATVNDKIYCAIGYSNITVYNRMEILFYNPILLGDFYTGTDLHELVYDGKWYYNDFLSIMKSVGNVDKEDPNAIYGWTARNDATTVDGWMGGLGMIFAKKNPDGSLTLDYENELNTGKMELLKTLYNDNLSGLISKTASAVENPFTSGKAIFHSNMLIASCREAFTNMAEFSILPIPKYDENQKEYRTVSHNEHSVMTIMQNNIDTDVTSAVLELVSYYGYQNMRPALFEKYFVQKMQTKEAMDMLYFILDSSFIDFGAIYCKELKSIPVYLREVIQNNLDVASRYAARRDDTQASFDNLVKFFSDED